MILSLYCPILHYTLWYEPTILGVTVISLIAQIEGRNGKAAFFSERETSAADEEWWQSTPVSMSSLRHSPSSGACWKQRRVWTVWCGGRWRRGRMKECSATSWCWAPSLRTSERCSGTRTAVMWRSMAFSQRHWGPWYTTATQVRPLSSTVVQTRIYNIYIHI